MTTRAERVAKGTGRGTGRRWRSGALAAAAALALAVPATGFSEPSVLIVTVDALRTDRLSAYGYERPTSPNIDRLLAAGVRFTAAHTVEPLTSPAMSSMVTSLPPHEHGGTRNGLRMRTGLDSLPKFLSRQGWKTAAIVGSWTLQDRLSRLGEHFDYYEGVLTRRRWWGMIKREATAADVTDVAAGWLERHLDDEGEQPFLVWVHYVEPHAPYRFQSGFAERLGISSRKPPASDRYDTEVAAVDYEIGRLLEVVRKRVRAEDLLVVFTADHGESLGEHNYWGHGRHLYEASLSIPFGITWPGRLEPRVVEGGPVISDVAATIVDLLGLEPPAAMRGASWAAAAGGGSVPQRESTCHEAHKGAVHMDHDSERARTNGLLEVGLVGGGHKEIMRVRSSRRWVFDLRSDPGEKRSLAAGSSAPSEELKACLADVLAGLDRADTLPTDLLDAESREQLKALGYLE